MTVHSLLQKIASASFEDVKAIYDSLPREQQLLVSPRGRFVDSPNLMLRTVDPDKEGFAEAYKMPGNKAFVTLAVSPDAQGKGKGTELLQQTLAKARDKKIRKVLYRVAKDNEASKAVVRKFSKKPHREGNDWEEYVIDPDSFDGSYAVGLPVSTVNAAEASVNQ